jgi:hypothetical protein
MFSGPPLPLSPDLLLSQLLAHARPHDTLGAWVRGSIRQLHLHHFRDMLRTHVLVSSDLGFLLGRCARVAVREEERVVVLEAETVIQWRALQVVTSTPYLPGLERLRVLFPRLQATERGFLVPVQAQSPEGVLARCLAAGVSVVASRIVYARAEGEEAIGNKAEQPVGKECHNERCHPESKSSGGEGAEAATVRDR